MAGICWDSFPFPMTLGKSMGMVSQIYMGMSVRYIPMFLDAKSTCLLGSISMFLVEVPQLIILRLILHVLFKVNHNASWSFDSDPTKNHG